MLYSLQGGDWQERSLDEVSIHIYIHVLGGGFCWSHSGRWILLVGHVLGDIMY